MPDIRQIATRFGLNLCECTPLSSGKSGACLFETDSCVIKYTLREGGEALWQSALREWAFYQNEACRELAPRLLGSERTDDYILLLLEKCAPYDAEADGLLGAAGLLARVHALPAERLPVAPCKAGEEEIAAAERGWRMALSEHGSLFDPAPLDAIASLFRAGALPGRAALTGLCHGDFHRGNLLRRAQTLLVCDWQSVCYGAQAEDLSLLLSRAQADGLRFDREAVLRRYCQARGALPLDTLRRDMALSALRINFLLWHPFLQGASRKKVASVYGETLDACRRLGIC